MLTVVEEILTDGTPHGKICIGFTPDEEISRGAKNFDVEGFDCTARVNPRTQARPGDEVRMAMDLTKLHIFDKETEQVITN